MSKSWLAILVVLLVGLVNVPTFGNAQGLARRDPVWRSDCVDCPMFSFQLGDRGLVLDSDGHAHVAYAGDSLYYAAFDGTTWTIEFVDDAPGIDDIYQSWASLAFDSHEVPAISYLSRDSRELRYARRTAAGWQHETVAVSAPGKQMAFGSSLAFTHLDRPAIAFSDYGDLKYAWWTGDHWQIDAVDRAGWSEWSISLVFDSHWQPRIGYFQVDMMSSKLRYATWTGGTWARETVDQAEWLGEFNSLVLDSADNPHFSYLDTTHSQLKYARRLGDTWDIQILDTVQWWGGFTSIAIDSNNRPHISYGGPPYDTLRYASWTGSSWETQSIPTYVWFTSLALDSTSRVIPA